MSRRRRPRATLLGACAVFGCAWLAGCGSSPPTRFYVLNEIAPQAAPPAAAASANGQLPVSLGSVDIAPELDRPQLITHVGANAVHVAESDRWAAPLDAQIRRTLVEDLAARLPPGGIAEPGQSPTGAAAHSLSLTLNDFYGDQSCVVTLHATWSLTSAKGPPRFGQEQVQIAGGAPPCTAELPAAMSRALAQLSDRLAAVILGG
ncbi:MAG: PqiC family protein [Steroidobacteraceae bacterium]